MKFSAGLLLVFAATSCGAASAQRQTAFTPFRFEEQSSPQLELASLHSSRQDLAHEDGYVHLYHSNFQNHRLRIKSTNVGTDGLVSSTDGWCDPGVKSYTGYLDVGFEKNLFFYFFESRSNPSKDDVVMWINGGPGSSSAMGLFMELGPCTIAQKPTGLNSTKYNPYSWNTEANIFFLDQPVNVGNSYAANGQHVGTTEEAAVDIQAFIAIFFDTFKQFEGRPLHLSGESYGGRYLPIFAAQIVDYNHLLEAPINLKSVIIGNGVTDRFDLTTKHYDIICTDVTGLPPVLSTSTCAKMQEAIPRCKKMMKESCIDIFDKMGCQAAINFCYAQIRTPFTLTGLNPYDISKVCDGQGCYGPQSQDVATYLNLPEVKKTLGISNAVNFTGSSSMVGAEFNENMDGAGKTYYYVTALLERGIRVLIYGGKYDFQCNFVHLLSWTTALDWTGKEEFNADPLRPWYVAGAQAGETRSTKDGRFTYVDIDGAGHMVPMDKPIESLAMLTRWLKGLKM